MTAPVQPELPLQGPYERDSEDWEDVIGSSVVDPRDVERFMAARASVQQEISSQAKEIDNSPDLTTDVNEIEYTEVDVEPSPRDSVEEIIGNFENGKAASVEGLSMARSALAGAAKSTPGRVRSATDRPDAKAVAQRRRLIRSYPQNRH